jgi:SAM-dependent methyltransferase
MNDGSDSPHYETIGTGYARTRRPDPRLAQAIWAALDGARRVVNVGAGTGNYEPTDRWVVAVEPALAMLAQRPAHAAAAIRAVAEALPFPAHAFDAALATFTLHHWQDWRVGLAELRRVARRQVIVLNEPAIGAQFWLADYFPEAHQLPSEQHAPYLADLQQLLSVQSITPLLIPADCTDGFVGAYWQRPEAYLDPAVQAGMSTLALLPPEIRARGVGRLAHDLESGVWNARYGHLRVLATYDVGYRLVVAGEDMGQVGDETGSV